MKFWICTGSHTRTLSNILLCWFALFLLLILYSLFAQADGRGHCPTPGVCSCRDGWQGEGCKQCAPKKGCRWEYIGRVLLNFAHFPWSQGTVLVPVLVSAYVSLGGEGHSVIRYRGSKDRYFYNQSLPELPFLIYRGDNTNITLVCVCLSGRMRAVCSRRLYRTRTLPL